MLIVTRRNFFRNALAATGALAAFGPSLAMAQQAKEKKFKISLAAWSLQPWFNKEWVNLDLPRIVREEFDLDGLEFVNSFFELPRYDYLNDLKKRASDYGVQFVLIMCDDEGDMSHNEKAEREKAVRQHHKWVDIAWFLGCHAIRGNARTDTPGTDEERVTRCAESYHELCEYADQAGISVIVENHGAFSSIPEYLVSLVKQVEPSRFGLLPDYGNFARDVDRYRALEMVMPYAKGVSVKCTDFDENGNHLAWDLDRLIKITLDAGYHGFMGIEAGSRNMRHHENVLACRNLLRKYQS
ncbi:MAG TPA: sugar phosphate isomerase/epimerase family protein [Candidatus Glassbacteria bacterium]|nr:sugar phosphate isomerase/epimerase family protein [Candidatus Glassbacteria bacterium]